MTKEVGGENLLQAVGRDAVLLRQDPLTGGEHGNDAAADGNARRLYEVEVEQDA